MEYLFGTAPPTVVIITTTPTPTEYPSPLLLFTLSIDALVNNHSSSTANLTLLDGDVGVSAFNDTPTTTTPTPTSTSPICFIPTTLESVPSTSLQTFLIALYSTTSLLALAGNLTVILVSSLGSESAPTIRLCLANLAVADIVLGVLCVPFTYTDFLWGQWIFPHWLCPTAQFVQLLSVFVTSLTLTVIGVERYMATLRPFSSLHRWLCTHTRLLLSLTWFAGCLYASIPLQHTGTRAFTLNGTTYYECSYDNGLSQKKRRAFMATNLLLTYLLPLTVLIAAYTAIMRKLLSDQPGAGKRERERDPLNGAGHVTGHVTTSYPFTANAYPVNGRPAPASNGLLAGNLKKGGKKKVGKTKEKTGFSMKMSWIDRGESATNSSTTTTAMMNATAASGSDSSPEVPTGLRVHGNVRAKNGAGGAVPVVSLRKSANTNRSKTIKMLFVVMALYGLCWAPIKLYQFLLDYGILGYCSEWSLQALIATYFSCHWLAMANSAVNPIVYSFMSRSFRADFRRITRSCRPNARKTAFSLASSRHCSLKTASTAV